MNKVMVNAGKKCSVEAVIGLRSSFSRNIHIQYASRSVTWVLNTQNCVFSHDVMAAIFMSQTSPVGVELFSYVNAFFCPHKFA